MKIKQQKQIKDFFIEEFEIDKGNIVFSTTYPKWRWMGIWKQKSNVRSISRFIIEKI